MDNSKFNAGPYVYDWVSKNNNSTSIYNRRIWFAVKNNSPIQFAKPVIDTTTISPNTQNNILPPLQNNILPFVRQRNTASPTPPYTPPTQLMARGASASPVSVIPSVGAPKTRLFYYYYDEPNLARKQEIDLCLQNNINNQQFNLIVLDSAEKPTFDFFFQKINQLAGPNDISIICSPDMFFDSSIMRASTIKQKEVYAITCSDWHRNGSITPLAKADSQGVWIIKGNVPDMIGDFPINKSGADNRIAYEFQKAGYKVINPSLSIKAFRVHDSGIGGSTDADKIPGPISIVEPTSL
jgi:hypothetical protein